jgi:serine/threonine protein kinase
MAPELLEKRPYRGTCVDIFAAGVVLFVMNTGTWPFEKDASINDPIYRYIVDKN